METARLYKLYCPFPSRSNPLAEEATRHTAEWMRTFNLIPDESVLERYFNEKHASLTARLYSGADLETLCTINDLYALLFIHDNWFDHGKGSEGIRDRHALEKFATDFIEVFEYNRELSPSDGNPFLAGLGDFWKRLRKVSKPLWRRIFVQNVHGLMQSELIEARNNKLLQFPTVEEYKKFRSRSGAGDLGIDLIEVAEKINLPDSVMLHAEVQDIIQIARDHSCWANDLFSYHKERKHGDVNNLVWMLMEERGLSKEEAMAETVQINNEIMVQFAEGIQQLPSFGKEEDKELQRYFELLGIFLRGCLDWQLLDTVRYGTDRPFAISTDSV